MLSVRVPVEERLARLAEQTGRSKSFYARAALVAHIDDLEDIYLGEKRLEDVRSGKDAIHPLANYTGGIRISVLIEVSAPAGAI